MKSPKMIALLVGCALVVIATTAATIVIVTSGNGAGEGDKGSDESALGVETIYQESAGPNDWHSFQSLDKMVRNSDMIVIARLQARSLASTPEPYTIPAPCDTPSPENAGKECGGAFTGEFGLYMSNYTFEIEQALKLEASAQSTVTVREPGGLVDQQEIVYMDRPAYRPGGRYLVFLKWWGPTMPDTAFTLDGIFGAYPISGDVVSQFEYAPTIAQGAPAALSGLTLEQAKSLIDQTLASTAQTK